MACGHAPAPKAAEVAMAPVVAPDKNASADTSSWADSESPIPVSSSDPVWGRRDAPVTIVVFSDFQCPFCARVVPTLNQVRETYGPDKVRIVWKNQPLSMHAKARGAAEAAMTVFALKGSDAFWKFHDLAFQNQRDLGPESYEKWAVAAGVDANAFKTALATKKASAKIDEDQQLASKVGANGTPAFRINGVELSGAHPFDKFKTVIDQELGKAQAKIASGTPKERIYVEISKENFEAAPQKQEEEGEEEDSATVWKVPVGSSPILGNADAPVTIVEFSDFQCPYCNRVKPTLEQIRTTYGDKVRLVWRDTPLPFHPRANPAAQLARFARAQKGDAGFWDVHDRLFASQPKLEDADLKEIARAAGLDVKKALSAVKNKTYQKGIEADEDLAEDVQASGTPHFFINGRRLVGAQPIEKFKAIIDDEIKKFEDQKGKVAAKDYYDHLMKTAKGAPEPEQKTAAPPTAPAPFMGAAKGTVIIQEWSDFQCPFCLRVEPTLNELVKAYPTQVKIVWRDMPLPMHSDAALAAEAAREAFAQKGNAGFAKMRKLLFANRSIEGGLQRPALESYAKQIGLDLPKFKSALDNHTHKAVIDAESTAGTDAGVTGTPSFLIGPYYLSGAQPLPRFKRLVERVLGSSKANAQ
ncbi:MAG: thioredoxin domain-containing protein [Polyangiaceae bacterium]|nr:thioredoxin domain-containing protein [Polyangiaceae bacterium]